MGQPTSFFDHVYLEGTQRQWNKQRYGWHVWNDIVSWRTRRLNNSTKYQLHAFQRRRIEIRGRIVKSVLSNCSEMLILGTYWTTWYFMVSKQARTMHNKNGLKLVTNDYLVWSLTFIIHVITNNIVMWETLPNNAKSTSGGTLCIFGSNTFCSNQLDVWETNLQFRIVQQNQKSFLWTLDWGWTENPHLICGIWSLQFFTETCIRVIKNGETRRARLFG